MIVPFPHGPFSIIQPGVINGAMPLMKRAFDLTPLQQEVVVSSTVLSAFVSSLVGGNLNNTWGRRKCILFCAIVFTIGSLWLMVAWDYYTLVLGRIIVGIAIGIASLTTPVYIAGKKSSEGIAPFVVRSFY
jgi:MFS family permease